ncbi:MAG: trypsin-like peptidase domain-containing protein, partial [Christensenellaceae bacterium]|nr:trypsin-like peptidase domain-containing protein [Christensenellaceae bacterium]
QLPHIGGNAPTITDYVNPVPDIAEQLSDGVVLITTEVTTQFRDGKEQTDTISGGTGFVISEEGFIVTNNHVIEGGSSFMVTLPNKSEYSAKLVGTDTETDLAVLKIEPKETLTVLPIGNSDKVRVGEMVIAIGNASGAGETLTGSVTVGYVSAVNREISFNGTQQAFIQTDAALNSGNSGGPLVNSKGEVVGVCTLKSLISSYTEYGESINSEGLGFAIPINKAMEKVQRIILSGSIKKPGIGLNYYQLNEEYCKEHNVPMGLLIDSFMPDSPSERAGLKVGDIIVKADGTPIEKIESISAYIGEKGIGGKVVFTVYRDGEYLDYSIDIEDVNAMR